MSLLCLVHQGSKLHKAHGRFAIARPEQAIVEVPIRDVEQVLVFGNIQLTTAAISTCLYQQIPVAFLSQTGQYKGQLWNAEHDDLRAEMAQFRRFEDNTFQAEMAKSLVTGKLWNSKQLLLKLNRRRNSEQVASAIAGLDQDLRKVERLEPLAEHLDVLRGLEGASAARYFPALGQLITQPDFELTHRSRRPPTDPINSLLSFGYTLLFNNVLREPRLIEVLGQGCLI
ncbi:MAG: CRISPR-associated endonuclease Cas1 [Thainema sp.]